MTEDEILAVEETTTQEETPAGDQTAAQDPAAPEEELQQIQVEVAFPERPFMTTPIDEYTVSEGLLLLLWLTIIVLAVIKFVRRQIEWLL